MGTWSDGTPVAKSRVTDTPDQAFSNRDTREMRSWI
jgi:hypothetical protein